MFKFIMRSLQLKLILGITMILALFIFTWQYLESRTFRQKIYQNLIKSCESMVEVIDKIWEEHMLTHKIPEAKKEIKTIGEIGRVKLIYFVNPGGKVRFSSNPKLVGKLYAREEIGQVEKTNRSYFKLLEKDAENTFFSLTPMRNKPECQHCHRKSQTIGYIGLDLDVKEEINFFRQSYQARMKRIILLSPIFYFLLILAIFLFLQVNVHRPLEIIRSGLNKVKQGIFGEKIAINSINEIGELANSFNSMTATLQKTSEELIRSAKMSTLGHLARAVGEELHIPLLKIKNNLNLLKTRLEKEPLGIKEIFLSLSENVAYAERTIGSILQVAAPSKLQLQPESINLLLEGTFSLMEKENLFEKIKVNKTFSPNLPLVPIDRERIEKTFYHLVLNAVEVMPNGGELTVTTTVENNAVKIVFTDTGGGIPEDKLKEIFSPFFTTKPKGSGLGLTIVKENVEKHQGKIKIDSVLGKGTTVILEFPIK